MQILWPIILIILGVLGSAFFSGMETGLISLNRVRLRHEVEHKNRRAIALNAFIESSERLLGTTLIGTTLANVIVSISASLLVARTVGGGYLTQLAATLIAASLLLIFGEIVPKTLFRHYPHRLCVTFADALEAMAWLFAPLVALLGIFMRGIARIGNPRPPKSFFVTREELKLLAKEGETGGAITAEEREMIHGVFDFPFKSVQEVMVPMSSTLSVHRSTRVREILDFSQRSGFARFPVVDGEKAVGVVNTYEILFEGPSPDGRTAEEVMQKLQFVRATDRINFVLPQLRSRRNPISVVVNDEGQHLGIVTIEDIVEEIVGEVEG
jgi:CBS domain containing-hemolysin-like protein